MRYILAFILGCSSLAPLSLHAADCGLYAYNAKIVHVVDGDTVDADIDLGFNTWRRDERLRLLGINAPETRGKEKLEGKRSRDLLAKKILNRDVVICTRKDRRGKYGRMLATIYLGHVNLNEWLVESGLAARVKY